LLHPNTALEQGLVFDVKLFGIQGVGDEREPRVLSKVIMSWSRCELTIQARIMLTKTRAMGP